MIESTTLFGVKIYKSYLAVEITKQSNIIHNPRRRRKKYFVRVSIIEKPACFKTPSGLYMHPILYEQLKQHKDVVSTPAPDYPRSYSLNQFIQYSTLLSQPPLRICIS